MGLCASYVHALELRHNTPVGVNSISKSSWSLNKRPIISTKGKHFLCPAPVLVFLPFLLTQLYIWREALTIVDWLSKVPSHAHLRVAEVSSFWRSTTLCSL